MTFTIRDLENLSGIKAHTIRIWEQRYSFLKPNRTGTNIRHYTNEELKKVLNIALLNKYGYKISHIDKMDEEEQRAKILTLSETEAQLEKIVIDLLHDMIELDMESFESVLNSYINLKGIEKTISQVIFPFLEKVGVLWQTSHIIPAQEHLVSNVIRQKLCAGIDGIQTSLVVNRSVCCFLPEGEYHELGLLYMHYQMKSRGIKVYYLGANVPLKDLEFFVKEKDPDFIYSHLTVMPHNFDFDKMVKSLVQKFSGRNIILTGNVVANFQKKLPSAISYKKSPSEVIEMVVED